MIVRAAQVENGVVLNLIMVSVDADGTPTFKPEGGADIVPLDAESPVDRGWTFENGEFAPPEVPVAEGDPDEPIVYEEDAPPQDGVYADFEDAALPQDGVYAEPEVSSDDE